MTCQRLPLFATKLVIAIKQNKNKKFINDEGGQKHLPIMARSLQFADRLLLVVPATNTNKKGSTNDPSLSQNSVAEEVRCSYNHVSLETLHKTIY